MSFALTTPQFKARTKTVTRRCGWWNVKPGEVIMGVEKCQGIPKGQKIVRMGPIEIVGARKEILNAITQAECILEGFPEMDPHAFVMMFMAANNCMDDAEVNRIEYKYL
jgi:hypothetical protein